MPLPNPPAIPRGVADYFGAAAVARRRAEASLRELGRRWAYVEVIPPTFEYAEIPGLRGATGRGTIIPLHRPGDGSALALRPDHHPYSPGWAGSKLFDQPLPLRFFYSGPAFRYEEPRAGRQRDILAGGHRTDRRRRRRRC
ncbi:MAG: ATP phosphoribosyltransferase regulatory subunit [Caldilineales bacterium]|nr:ATP phosphoribosyltransferase regulatory subunit [Caldilineales bacterium]